MSGCSAAYPPLQPDPEVAAIVEHYRVRASPVAADRSVASRKHSTAMPPPEATMRSVD